MTGDTQPDPSTAGTTSMAVRQIEFVSTLPVEWRDEVESLFFFNPRQNFLRERIRLAVMRFGLPQVEERDGHLWIELSSGCAQCLFAVDASAHPAQLAGGILFQRTAPHTLSIAQIAVDSNYAMRSGSSGEGVGLVLLKKVCEIAHRINGVSRVELPYQPGCFIRIPGATSATLGSQ